jgi:hypothetical protein
MNRTDRQFLTDLGAPPTGASTDQTVTRTGDTDGARAARKAAAMHGTNAARVDKAAEAAIDKAEARAERGATAMPTELASAPDIRAARAARRAADRQRKHAAA